MKVIFNCSHVAFSFAVEVEVSRSWLWLSFCCLLVVPRHRMYWRQRNLPLTKSTTCQLKEVVASSVAGGAMTSSSERTAIKASKRATTTDTAMTIILIGHTMVGPSVSQGGARESCCLNILTPNCC